MAADNAVAVLADAAVADDVVADIVVQTMIGCSFCSVSSSSLLLDTSSIHRQQLLQSPHY